jgi:hypothetical protein
MKELVPTRFRDLLELLTAGRVEFIVIGGVAATVHGSALVTTDLDVVYRRTPDNIDHVVATLSPIGPYPRGAPPGLPFLWDRRTVTAGLNFTFDTSFGIVHILGEVTGGGSYEQLLPHSAEVEAFGVVCR